jgi:hypothetical protein
MSGKSSGDLARSMDTVAKLGEVQELYFLGVSGRMLDEMGEAITDVCVDVSVKVDAMAVPVDAENANGARMMMGKICIVTKFFRAVLA